MVLKISISTRNFNLRSGFRVVFAQKQQVGSRFHVITDNDGSFPRPTITIKYGNPTFFFLAKFVTLFDGIVGTYSAYVYTKLD